MVSYLKLMLQEEEEIKEIQRKREEAEKEERERETREQEARQKKIEEEKKLKKTQKKLFAEIVDELSKDLEAQEGLAYQVKKAMKILPKGDEELEAEWKDRIKKMATIMLSPDEDDEDSPQKIQSRDVKRKTSEEFVQKIHCDKTPFELLMEFKDFCKKLQTEAPDLKRLLQDLDDPQKTQRIVNQPKGEEMEGHFKQVFADIDGVLKFKKGTPGPFEKILEPKQGTQQLLEKILDPRQTTTNQGGLPWGQEKQDATCNIQSVESLGLQPPKEQVIQEPSFISKDLIGLNGEEGACE